MKTPRFTPADIAALESGLALRQQQVDTQWQLVRRLMAAAFDGAREPRSPAYQAGVRAALAHKLCGTPKTLPFDMGTAQADAWLAGCDEAYAILKQRLQPQPASV
ncbi:MAG: hypothetical protein IPN53_15220 [Comamonadaceae bacterium]|nr:hypothetical protein [Comamonadaceae bacterium]